MALVVVGVLADEVDPARRGEDPLRCVAVRRGEGLADLVGRAHAGTSTSVAAARRRAPATSGATSVRNAPPKVSEPARYLSLPSPRCGGQISRCRWPSARSSSVNVHRGAVDAEQVGRLEAEERVVAGEDAGEDPGQVVAGGGAELGQRADVVAAPHVDLVGEARPRRHPGEEVGALDHDARAAGLLGDDVAEHAAPGPVPVLRGRALLARRARRHVGVGVDLAVRVVQRHADGLALVLERQHVADARGRRRARRSGAPRRRRAAGPARPPTEASVASCSSVNTTTSQCP